MEFNHFLSSYFPDPSYGGHRLFADMLEQAQAADRLGYHGVTIPEHHLINILLTPSPLQMAVKVASITKHVEVVTSVAVLPIRDMRVFAGEVTQADILTNGRLVLGVGRGAFAYEIERFGVRMEETRAKFDESVEVLIALLSQEEVGWSGEYYNFQPITIMPRPLTQPLPRMMIAVMDPSGIAASTRRGFHIQTTPLAGKQELFKSQITAHKEAKASMGKEGEHLRIMMSRVTYCAEDEAEASEILSRAYEYYGRFNNVFTGPGEVENGCILALPCIQSIEELEQNLLIGTPNQLIDRMAEYHEAGIDEYILSSNLGQPQSQHLEAMQRFAEEVMPNFRGPAGVKKAA